jgi:hypothetical protein
MAAQRIDAEMQRVGRSIDGWRRSRTGSSAMPEELWVQAVALAKDRGVSRVSTALGLGYYGLRKRVESPIAPAGFVEIGGAEFLGHAKAGTVVEVRAADGAELTVRLAAGSSVDIAALVEQFRRAQR